MPGEQPSAVALQDREDVYLSVLVSSAVAARDVHADFSARSLRLAVGGQIIVTGDLPKAIHPDDCTWQFGAQSALPS